MPVVCERFSALASGRAVWRCIPAEPDDGVNRGDWQKLEPAATVQPYVMVFMHGRGPLVSRIVGMAG